MSLWKHGFNGEYYTIGLSEHGVTPMVSGNFADILSLELSHLFLWFTRFSSSVVDQSFNLKKVSPLLFSEGAQSLSFHRTFPKGLGCSLEASTAIGLWSQEESRLLIA